jgi:hypothetical protein
VRRQQRNAVSGRCLADSARHELAQRIDIAENAEVDG